MKLTPASMLTLSVGILRRGRKRGQRQATDVPYLLATGLLVTSATTKDKLIKYFRVASVL